MKNLGKMDWRMLQRYTNPQAVKDFDAFLDALPVNAGYNALIAAGIAWVIAGASVLFTSMELERVTDLRAEMMKIESLTPPIPVLQYVSVPQTSIDELGKKITATYPGITVAASEGKATVSASDTAYWPQFMAAISTMQNGGKSWKVSTDTMCVGRDCKSAKLTAELKIEIVRIGEPVAEQPAMEGMDGAMGAPMGGAPAGPGGPPGGG